MDEQVNQPGPPVQDDVPASGPADLDGGGLLWRMRANYARWRRKQKARQDEKAFRRAYETPNDEDSFAPVKLKPLYRGPRRVISWPVLLAGGLLLIAGGAVLLAIVFPYERFRPEVEQRLGSALGDKVRIGELHFAILPYPNITLVGVSIGAEPYAEAKAIRVVPEPFSLFGSQWVIRHARLEGLLIRRLGITPSAHWFAATPGREPALLLRHGQIERLSVEIADARLDGLSGEVKMRADGGVEQIQLSNASHSLNLEATPAAAGYRLSLIGNGLNLPFRADLTFEYLEAEGNMSSGLLRLRKIAGRIYGGLIEGTAQLDWSATPIFQGDIGLIGASAARLLAALDPDVSMEGNISGIFHIESRANDVAQLDDRLLIKGEFRAERGVLNRFDFIEAVRSSRQTRGGNTRFETFSGDLLFDKSAWHFGRLKLDSGLLQAAGNLDIGAGRQLRGMMELDLKGSATRLHSLVMISGPVEAPLLSVTQSTRR